MAAQWCMWFIWFPAVIQCYNSICETTRCTATQSSTRVGLSADKVIDGDNLQFYNRCSHTAENKTGQAWVMVDLRKEYRLKNIKIFYRDDETAGGTWRPYRFRQYALEVSSNAQTWIQCYKDTTTFPTIPLNIQNIPCEVTARYLRIITNYEAPENENFTITGAILEICEIQVYGDCMPGHYGQACQPCNKNCQYGSCDGGDGRCIRGCAPGYYGSHCNWICSQNCKNNVCDQTNGTCSCVPGWNPPHCDGCLPGYFGPACQPCSKICREGSCDGGDGRCIRGCSQGYYGSYCNRTCSNNCKNNVCDQTRGTCSCVPGWTPPYCVESCSSNCEDMECDAHGNCIKACVQGYQGYKCQENCPSKCQMGCDRFSGDCHSCRDGYWGRKCQKECLSKCSELKCGKDRGYLLCKGCLSGYYGPYCDQVCGNCSTGTCEKDHGNCGACKTGFYGVKCKQTCRNTCHNKECIKITGYCRNGCNHGFYGKFCHLKCSRNCAQPNCFRNGTCINRCKQNWSGSKCDECDSNHYGLDCSMECSVNCERQTCDSITGSCTYGCKRGFYLEKCNQNCNESCPSACNRYSGYCEGKCPPGKYGNACNKICNPNCKNECGRNNGLCDSGCIFGKFGADCLRSCGAGCVSSCRQNDGSCQCKSGWKGPNCDGCDLKHYEQDCSKKCSANCERENCDNITGSCTHGCERGFYLEKCEKRCSTSCPSACNRYSGECEGECSVGKYGEFCNKTCSQTCNHRCRKIDGLCTYGCIDGKFGAACLQTCGDGCISGCHQTNGNCSCKTGWQGQNCDECSPNFYGNKCDRKCSSNCLNETCFSKNGFCIGGCKGDFTDEQCTIPLVEGDSTSLPFTAIGAGLGAGLFLLVIIIIVVIFLRRRKNSYSKPDTVLFRKEGTPSIENRLCMNIGDVPITIEDPEEEPQIENPEEAVYYNELSVAKDISVSDLLKIITEREAKENEGFLKEFKMLPYGERFDCEIAKAEKNMPKNRFKTTFPYDHSRVVLDTSQGFTSDYINANYIENMEGERDFIACQGPLKNTLVDHWRMIWQENVEYIVMLTNLIEGPKVKCHQYWPDKGQELDVNPFAVTLVEEKQYAYFVERRMTLRNKKVAGSRTIVQYHYTRWPDHGTPNPLNLIVFHRHFRHKSRSTQHPIIVHCSAGIGRTGTFIALDVLCRYGKDKGKVNVIEYVKAMRRDRMTMIQNVDQYVFLYHALYEFFRRKVHYIKRDEFLSQYGDMNKMLTNEFNELVSLKPKYDASEFKSGKKFSELNFTKSVLPVEQHLVYLTSHVQGRQCYYNAVNVCSFTRADEFLSAQFPVSGAAIDLVRLLTDQESAFLISLNPLSELKELQSWVDGKDNPLKLNPYVVTKGSQEVFSGKIRKTNLKISTKEETHHVEIFECLNWSSKDTLPTDTSVLTTLIKQFSLDRKANINGPVTVISKDGATCCGVFIAVYNAIEQLQQDDEVDIFTIVQQIQCRRPEMISTKDEYEFCFKAVSDFLNTESVYANT